VRRLRRRLAAFNNARISHAARRLIRACVTAAVAGRRVERRRIRRSAAAPLRLERIAAAHVAVEADATGKVFIEAG
jgi:hypothetical protein